MSETARLMPGMWRCFVCRRSYALRFTPGVLASIVPRELPPKACATEGCAGNIVAADDRAIETEKQVRQEAKFWDREMEDES